MFEGSQRGFFQSVIEEKKLKINWYVSWLFFSKVKIMKNSTNYQSQKAMKLN